MDLKKGVGAWINDPEGTLPSYAEVMLTIMQRRIWRGGRGYATGCTIPMKLLA
jgi:hypothetical protein